MVFNLSNQVSKHPACFSQKTLHVHDSKAVLCTLFCRMAISVHGPVILIKPRFHSPITFIFLRTDKPLIRTMLGARF